MRKATLLAALLLLAPAASQAKTLEELLVEKGVITRGEAGGVSDAGASKVYWNKGTRLEFPDTGFTARINTQIQSRYTFTDADEDTGDKNTSSFSLRRARLVLSGSALNNEFSYKLQSDFVGTTDENGQRTPQLRDAYLQWNACDEQGGIRFGQFKTQISRQFNNESQALQFPDRSVVSDYYDLDRQVGAMAFGSWMDGDLTASAGVFNGSSDGEGINKPGRDTKHAGVVAVRGNVLGKMNAYEEGDIDWTEDPAVNIGGAYAYSDGNNDLGGGVQDVDFHTVSVDANFKWMGWSAHGEIFNSSYRPDVGGESEPTGFYAQGGYFVVPKKLEIAARYSYLDCDDGEAVGDCSGLDKINEVGASVNYFFWKHYLKAQLAYTLINEDSMEGADSDVNTNRWIFQVSGYF